MYYIILLIDYLRNVVCVCADSMILLYYTSCPCSIFSFHEHARFSID